MNIASSILAIFGFWNFLITKKIMMLEYNIGEGSGFLASAYFN